MSRRTFMIQGLSLAGTSWLPAARAQAQAQAWPAKPVKLIVPYIAGSAPDQLARTIGDRLGPALGQPIVVENRPGAGGNIGFEAIARAPNDGYTLGLATPGISINPFLYRKVSFDVGTDFTPVNLTFAMPHALVVQGDSPARSTQDLIRLLKANPGKFNYASGGNGTGAHLCAELFKTMANVEAVHVPYKGAPEILTSVISGDALFGFPTLATALPLVKSGKLRALAVSGMKRNPALPDSPTLGDTLRDFELTSWFGLIGPARMPAEALRRIDQEMARIMADTAFKDKVQSNGTEAVGMPSTEFGAYFSRDLLKWKRAVEVSGARID